MVQEPGWPVLLEMLRRKRDAALSRLRNARPDELLAAQGAYKSFWDSVEFLEQLPITLEEEEHGEG